MTPCSNPVTATIVAFLREIGLEVRAGELPDATFLPGVLIADGGLVIDETWLLYPGDLLHEAGHLAVATPERRRTMQADAGGDPAEEMMAIGWSYAAALHLHLDPAVVFHPRGYNGGSSSLLDNFAHGRYIGVPMLQWVGMTLDERQAVTDGLPPYPSMRSWLRPA